MELTVQILSFGSAWWVRPGRDEMDSDRYTSHAAYFNSTGIVVGSKIHTAGPVQGLVRFNATSGLDPHHTLANVGRIFRSNPMERYRDTNRLLFLGAAARETSATHFLVCLNNVLHGMIRYRNLLNQGDVQLIALSRYRGKQEGLLLLARDARISTTNGIWAVVQNAVATPKLMLLAEEESQTHAI